jgi:uncharacterized damage-inducible protein DinB
MNAIDLIRRLHQHRNWVNRQLLMAAQTLNDEQLHRPIAIGQGSVWKTLTHLLAAEYVWLEALCGNEDPLLPGDVSGKLPGNQAAAGAMQSLDQLREQWQALDERWNEYVARLSDESLDEVVYKISTSSGFGKRHGTRRADVLIHVCTHAQYTTAQFLNMLRQLGMTQLPDPMLISLARSESRPQASI